MTSQVPRVAIVGLGGQGSSIARLVLDLGYTLLGAVDVGEKVGRPIGDLVDHPRAPDAAVQASIGDVIAAAGAPDVVVLSALVPTEQNVAIACELLERGINVLTLDANLFEGEGPFAARLDAAARTGGASIAVSGMQDTWWVHLPAVAAAANHRITRVAFNDFSNCARFPRDIGIYEAALGLRLDEFDAWAQPHLEAPPLQGAPLRECARRMGLTPADTTFEIQPITQAEPADWFTAGVIIPPGEIVGARYLVQITTAEGPVFTGDLRFQVRPADVPSTYAVTISGETELTLQVPATAQWLYVPLGLVRRIPDVIAAPAGLARMHTLGPSRYAHAVA